MYFDKPKKKHNTDPRCYTPHKPPSHPHLHFHHLAAPPPPPPAPHNSASQYYCNPAPVLCFPSPVLGNTYSRSRSLHTWLWFCSTRPSNRSLLRRPNTRDTIPGVYRSSSLIFRSRSKRLGRHRLVWGRLEQVEGLL